MTRTDFVPVMAYLSTAIGKPLSAEQVEVYFDLLGDLQVDVLRIAVKRVALEHKWATFPTVAEIREVAALTMQGECAELSPAEAWDLAWRAACRIDLEVEGLLDRRLASLPPRVVEAMRAYGIPDLCYGKEPVGVIRSQFMKIYEQLLARDRRTALLPASLRKAIVAAGEAALPPPARPLLAKKLLPDLGKMPETTAVA